jgi:nucleotide-binding universal stress UspA family protein
VRTVVLANRPQPEWFWDEVRTLAELTRGRSVRALAPKGASPPEMTIGRAKLESQLVNATDDTATIVRRDLPGLDCGCLVLPKKRAGFWNRIGFGRPAFADLLPMLSCPLLLAAGSHPYRRILLPVLDPDPTVLAAELAIDLARQLEIGVTAIAVTPPPFIVGQEAVEEQKESLKTVMEVGALYHRKLDQILIEGNPAKEIARIATKGDLLVIALPAGRHGSFLKPDTAVQIVTRCESSVLALSHRERVHGTV